jgi:calcineurin-like phosphoesterase family protein
MSINNWFCSDHHFGHDNIRRFCDRPFDSLLEMNEALIENHNAMVQPNDHVYFVGDFSYKMSKGRTIEILKRLNGKKHMILGNHDKVLTKPDILSYVEWVKERFMLTIQDKSVKHNKQLIVLDHYSGRVWNKKHWGSWQLYGHSHSTLPDEPDALAIDVGVDAIARRYAVDGILNPQDYRPICYEEIKVIMENKNLPVDRYK